MQKKIIVIIGGPGTGKSTIIDALIQRGYCCYPEISREITLNAKKEGIDQLFLQDPLLFSKLLFEGRIKQYENAVEEPHDLVFLDRGIPDVLAYLHYIGKECPFDFIEACKTNVYSKVFVLPPWEEIYLSDAERYENFEQANLIHNFIQATYQNYGYELIEVPKNTVDNRILFILDKISQ